MSSYKIAVLGDKESIVGFKALGLETIFAETTEEARVAFTRLARHKEEYAIIYITEQLAKNLTVEIDDVKDNVTPAVILIPSKNGSLGLGMSALTTAIERAIGADIG